MRVRISRGLLEALRQESAAAWPAEACGLLFGNADEIDGFQPAENVADAPEHRFEIDPAALFAALRVERAGGPHVIGYWHSHPSGDPAPSVTDAAMAEPDGKLWLILGAGGYSLHRALTKGLLHGRFDPVHALEV
jgi:proteasome lid subunit RPN8/RPN11